MSALRLDRVATVPGAVRSARTYSLVLDDDALYVLDVGPAMGPKANVGGLAQWLANKMIARMEKRTNAKVEAGLADLNTRGAEALASEKGSFRFAPLDVSKCTMGTNCYGRTALKLKTDARSFAFVPPPGGEAALDAFATAISSWAMDAALHDEPTS